jgi:hypothetical protein
MSRSGESVTRLDIRFPNEMYDKLQQIAIKDGARTHHISQKVEVSPTVIKLVQFAFDTLAGMVSDSGENVPDSLPDMSLKMLSDKDISISDKLSDKMVEGIVDRRLKELGLFPECQIEDEAISPPLSDKHGTVPDSISDKDIMISDKNVLLPDNLSDTKNIPSDDSELVTKCDAVELSELPTKCESVELVGEVPQSFSFGEFHDWLGLTRAARNKANRDNAIDFARSQGRGEWVMDKSHRFTKQSADK